MSAIYDYIAGRYTTLIEEDLEADDLLSMLQHEEDTFIFSHDKDLKQVPGYHYNMDVGQLLYTDEEEGMRLLVGQCLKGDTTDNIPGLHRFGEKAVEKFHQECEGMPQDQMVFCAMQKFIEKHGCRHGVDLFVEMWSLVSMRMNRGQYLRERYIRSFSMIDALLKKEPA